jgi:Peptidase family M23
VVTLSGKARSVAAALALGVVWLGVTAGEARGSPGWRWPVEGRVITAFSNDAANPYAGGMHRGIDIAAPAGAAVVAAHAGAVTYAGALGYSGLTVAVRTTDGYVTSYLHLGAVSVRRGDQVEAGRAMGEVGTTGRRSKPEPHLHFGVRVAGAESGYVDPLSLLPAPAGGSQGAAPAPAPAVVPVAPQEAPAAAAPARAGERVPVRTARPVGRGIDRPLSLPVHPAAPAARAAARVPVLGRAPRDRVPVAPGALPAPAKRAVPEPAARPAPAPPVAAQPARDWGRALALGGVALLVLALIGRGAWRAVRAANGAAIDRARAAARRALRTPWAYLPRSRRAT